MNEWGIPDWRDPASYGDTKKWSPNRWRWEFTRRRPDYRKAFDESAQESHDMALALKARGLHGKRILSPDEPGFCSTATIRQRSEFGLSTLPNPRISEQPLHVIYFNGSGISFFLGEGPDFPYDDERTARVEVSKNKIAVVFDLDRPIPQLKSVRDSLKARQQLAFGKKIPVRRQRHPEKLLCYLRVLDGRATGASWKKLNGILPKHVRQDPQAARDFHKAAARLMFKWPD